MSAHIRRIKSSAMKLIAELGLVPPNEVDKEGGLDLASDEGIPVRHSSSKQTERAEAKPVGDGSVNQQRLEPKN
jgi:hypothetical protein